MSLNITGLQSASSPFATAAATVSPYDTLSTPQNPLTDPNGPFANLDLTPQQQTEIQQILTSNSQSGSQTQTPTQLFQQVENVLTPQQQSQLKTDLETQSAHHHHHHHSSSTDSSDSSSSASAYTSTGAAKDDASSSASLDTNA